MEQNMGVTAENTKSLNFVKLVKLTLKKSGGRHVCI